MSHFLADEILSSKPRPRIDWVRQQLKEELVDPGHNRDVLYEIFTRKDGKAFLADVPPADAHKVYAGILAAIAVGTFTDKQQAYFESGACVLRQVFAKEQARARNAQAAEKAGGRGPNPSGVTRGRSPHAHVKAMANDGSGSSPSYEEAGEPQFSLASPPRGGSGGAAVPSYRKEEARLMKRAEELEAAERRLKVAQYKQQMQQLAMTKARLKAETAKIEEERKKRAAAQEEQRLKIEAREEQKQKATAQEEQQQKAAASPAVTGQSSAAQPAASSTSGGAAELELSASQNTTQAVVADEEPRVTKPDGPVQGIDSAAGVSLSPTPDDTAEPLHTAAVATEALTGASAATAALPKIEAPLLPAESSPTRPPDPTPPPTIISPVEQTATATAPSPRASARRDASRKDAKRRRPEHGDSADRHGSERDQPRAKSRRRMPEVAHESRRRPRPSPEKSPRREKGRKRGRERSHRRKRKRTRDSDTEHKRHRAKKERKKAASEKGRTRSSLPRNRPAKRRSPKRNKAVSSRHRPSAHAEEELFRDKSATPQHARPPLRRKRRARTRDHPARAATPEVMRPTGRRPRSQSPSPKPPSDTDEELANQRKAEEESAVERSKSADERSREVVSRRIKLKEARGRTKRKSRNDVMRVLDDGSKRRQAFADVSLPRDEVHFKDRRSHSPTEGLPTRCSESREASSSEPSASPVQHAAADSVDLQRSPQHFLDGATVTTASLPRERSVAASPEDATPTPGSQHCDFTEGPLGAPVPGDAERTSSEYYYSSDEASVEIQGPHSTTGLDHPSAQGVASIDEAPPSDEDEVEHVSTTQHTDAATRAELKRGAPLLRKDVPGVDKARPPVRLPRSDSIMVVDVDGGAKDVALIEIPPSPDKGKCIKLADLARAPLPIEAPSIRSTVKGHAAATSASAQDNYNDGAASCSARCDEEGAESGSEISDSDLGHMPAGAVPRQAVPIAQCGSAAHAAQAHPVKSTCSQTSRLQVAAPPQQAQRNPATVSLGAAGGNDEKTLLEQKRTELLLLMERKRREIDALRDKLSRKHAGQASAVDRANTLAAHSVPAVASAAAVASTGTNSVQRAVVGSPARRAGSIADVRTSAQVGTPGSGGECSGPPPGVWEVPAAPPERAAALEARRRELAEVLPRRRDNHI